MNYVTCCLAANKNVDINLSEPSKLYGGNSVRLLTFGDELGISLTDEQVSQLFGVLAALRPINIVDADEKVVAANG